MVYVVESESKLPHSVIPAFAGKTNGAVDGKILWKRQGGASDIFVKRGGF